MKSTSPLYFIPGLGFDHRMFDRLNLSDFDLNYINWIEPERKESIQSYARRLAEGIEHDNQEVVLVGHSLGGIVAQEITAVIPIKRIFLISSIKSRDEMPWFFKAVQPLSLHHFFTKEICTGTLKYWGENHGYQTEEEQTLFKSMVGQQTNAYLQWALKSLSTWQTPKLPTDTSIFHIHGTDDKNFPIKLLSNVDVVVNGGSHFMTFQRGEEIGAFLRKEL